MRLGLVDRIEGLLVLSGLHVGVLEQLHELFGLLRHFDIVACDREALLHLGEQNPHHDHAHRYESYEQEDLSLESA